MNPFKVFKIYDLWGTSRLIKKVENELDRLNREGYTIISVSFSIWQFTAFITTKRDLKMNP
ncbi:MAG: hypothetical protein QM539_04090 [Alphaproteobacteria bacterium]|nr:hypothetical protein [Alphaproteobacteria bacterium]